jgi:hypothetical protein
MPGKKPHKIYLSNIDRTRLEKLKTAIGQPMKRKKLNNEQKFITY